MLGCWSVVSRYSAHRSSEAAACFATGTVGRAVVIGVVICGAGIAAVFRDGGDTSMDAEGWASPAPDVTLGPCALATTVRAGASWSRLMRWTDTARPSAASTADTASTVSDTRCLIRGSCCRRRCRVRVVRPGMAIMREHAGHRTEVWWWLCST